MIRLLALLAVLAAALVLPSLVNAHSWYPSECCSDRDCYPVPIKRIDIVPGGWLVEGKDFIPYAQARPSPDGQFHICRYDDGKGGLISQSGKPACFWAPMGAS